MQPPQVDHLRQSHIRAWRAAYNKSLTPMQRAHAKAEFVRNWIGILQNTPRIEVEYPAGAVAFHPNHIIRPRDTEPPPPPRIELAEEDWHRQLTEHWADIVFARTPTARERAERAEREWFRTHTIDPGSPRVGRSSA